MRFRGEYTTAWDIAVNSKAYKWKRKEIHKRCNDILNGPYVAHNAHPYHGRWEGHMAANLDAVNRIMYTINEGESVVTFRTIINAHPRR